MVIENGKVTVGVTKNMGDYNQKKVEVVLSFQVQDGEDAESVVSAVVEMAERRAQGYIEGRSVETRRVVLSQESADPPVYTMMSQEWAPEEKRKQRKAAAPEKPQEKVITDADLHSAVSRRCEKVSGLAPRVRELMKKYGATDLTKIEPQDRKTFLADLEKLSAPGAITEDVIW